MIGYGFFYYSLDSFFFILNKEKYIILPTELKW